MKTLMSATCVALMALSVPAWAEFQHVTTRADFLALVKGKTLTRPLVKLQLTPNGGISGKGASWAVSGQWQWKGNYLCRSLEWGGDDLGYNCQEIKVKGNTMRITSDKGTGQSADFRLR